MYQLEVQPAAMLAIIEPEILTAGMIEQQKYLGTATCLEVIVHPDATRGATRVETTAPTQPFQGVRVRPLDEAFDQEFAAEFQRNV